MFDVVIQGDVGEQQLELVSHKPATRTATP